MEDQSYLTTTSLINALKELHKIRKDNKIASNRRQVLTSNERVQILEKTDNRCHVCGTLITGKFHADHVKCHSSGGDHNIANYLPSCESCNRYRWHYSSEEIQFILKIGVWVRSQIEKETKLGQTMAEAFVGHESKIRSRRKLE